MNAFLTARVVLVGGLLIALPRIGHTGLLFGVYVGEQTTTEDGSRDLLKSWTRACLVLMAKGFNSAEGSARVLE